MYYLNKIVGWVMSPMGILFLGMGFGLGFRVLGLGLRRIGLEFRVLGLGLRRIGLGFRVESLELVGKWVIGATLVGFWVMGCPITTRVIGVPLEGEEEEFRVEGLEFRVEGVESRVEGLGLDKVDAIVCLGGGIGKHEKCGRTELFGGADRAWEAARRWKAYQDGKMPLICTGVGCAEATIPFLVDLGVPREFIIGFESPRNTEEEAKLIAERLAGFKLKTLNSKLRVALVTSAWHMPRAKMLFERAGLVVVPAPTDYEMTAVAEQPIEFGDFFPNADALWRNSAAIKEWVARIGYAVLRR